MRGAYWSEEELSLLLDIHKAEPFNYVFMAGYLNRSVRSIKHKLLSLGIKKFDSPNHPGNKNRQEASDIQAKEFGMYPKFFYGFKAGAEGRKRGGVRPKIREFSITPEYMLDLFEKQKGRCYLSGVPLVIPMSRYDFTNKLHTASIDRIDSSLGYIEGNVAWAHKEVNMMKGSMPNEKLIEWARVIAARNPESES